MMNDKERALPRAERSKTQRYSDVELPEYEYSELEDMKKRIRILKLVSSSIQNPIIDCELFEVEFDKRYVPHGVPDQEDNPSFTPPHLQRSEVIYEALSWCWGREAADCAIHIRRGSKKYKLRAKKELVLALKYLRDDREDRYLWIDAVCINQANPTERNHQVQIMAMIYSRAKKVCVWLGDDDDDSEVAIKFINEEIMKLERFDDICKNKANANKWQALLALMQRPWFGRRWVVQEIALAIEAHVYCGPDQISWKDFAVAVELFVEVETATHRLSEVIQKDERFYHVPGWFEYVSHLGASLLVGATAKVFRATETQTEDTKTDQPRGRNQLEHGGGSGSESSGSSRTAANADIALPTTSDASQHITSDNSTPKEQSNTDAASINKSDPDGEGVPVDPRGRRGLLSLEYLVSTLFTFEATEPRDAIYALLAIAKDTSPSAEVNDYHGDKSKDALLLSTLSNFLEKKPYRVDYTLPYSDVCKDFISFCIERSQASDPSRFLDIICRPWALKPPKTDDDPTPSQSSRSKKRKPVKTTLSSEQKKPKGIFVDRKRVPLLKPRQSPEFKIRTKEAKDAGHKDREVVDSRSMAEYREQVSCKEESVHEEIWKYFPRPPGDNPDSASQPTSHRKDINLPTWVATVDSAPFGLFQHPGMHFPRTGRKNADPLVGLPEDGDRTYCAAQKQKPEDKTFDLEFRKRPILGHYSFYVKGFVLDEIVEVTAPAYGGNIPKAWTHVGGWADVRRDDPPDAFLRTLVADRGKGNRNPPHYYSKACRESIGKGSIESGRVNVEALINSEQNSIITEFCRRVQEVIWNRRLIKTKRGILGLAAEAVEAGDLVCIVYGCSVPVILRRHFKGTFVSELTKELLRKQYEGKRTSDDAAKESSSELTLQGIIDAIERWHLYAKEKMLGLIHTSKDDVVGALQHRRLGTSRPKSHGDSLKTQLECEDKEDDMEKKIKQLFRRFEIRLVQKARYRELCEDGFEYGEIKFEGEEYRHYVENITSYVNDHLKGLRGIAKRRDEAENEAKKHLAKAEEEAKNHPAAIAREQLKKKKRTTPKKENAAVEEKKIVDKEYFYHVMGESYIHGMMDGEAIREKFARSLPQHRFELR
ncbi:heterokaryon incompatibility protein-domain-containing protein [Apiospora sp. TS-2023a]